MSKLTFKAADVRRIVEHALSAKEHARELVKYDEDSNPITKPGRAAVLFVHDDGVYLMSNGEPRDLIKKRSRNGKHEIDSSFCAYAKGCNPSTDAGWYDTARALVGGDDFGETLHWAEQIKQFLDDGADEIELLMTADSIELVQPRRRRKANGR